MAEPRPPWPPFSPANLSNMARCNFMNTSSGIPRLDNSMISWWFRKTAWGRDVCSTSSRRCGLSNLRMLGRKTALFPERLGSSVKTPLQPANRIWIADGTKSLPIFLATCENEMHSKVVIDFQHVWPERQFYFCTYTTKWNVPCFIQWSAISPVVQGTQKSFPRHPKNSSRHLLSQCLHPCPKMSLHSRLCLPRPWMLRSTDPSEPWKLPRTCYRKRFSWVYVKLTWSARTHVDASLNGQWRNDLHSLDKRTRKLSQWTLAVAGRTQISLAYKFKWAQIIAGQCASLKSFLFDVFYINEGNCSCNFQWHMIHIGRNFRKETVHVTPRFPFHRSLSRTSRTLSQAFGTRTI